MKPKKLLKEKSQPQNPGFLKSQSFELKKFEAIESIPKEELEAMIKAGIFWGHKPSKTHPKMREYICGLKSNVTIIDLEKSYQKLNQALKYLEEKLKEKKDFLILFLGTTPPAKKAIFEIAKKFDFPYVIERWIGGTLTNFKEIFKRLNYFKELEEKKAKGELEKYPKKEQLDFERELVRLNKLFGGIKNMTRLPDLLFAVGVSSKNHLAAIKEANRLQIPVMAIVDTDGNPDSIEIVIPANDDAQSAIEFVLDKISKVIEKNKKIEPLKEQKISQKPQSAKV